MRLTVVLLLGMSPVAGISQAVGDGELLLKAGKFSAACDAFEAVLRRNAGDAEARAGEIEASERLALEDRAAGKKDDALKALLQGVSYVPESAQLHYDLGILEDEMGLFVDADQSLARVEAIEGGAERPEVLYAVGRVKLDLGQLAVAEEKIGAYLQLRPQDASAHYGLGRVYRLELDFVKAKAEFRTSIELKPKQTEAYYELGDAELEGGNFAEAQLNFEKTLERNPRHGGALTGMGVAYFKMKEYSKAEEWLGKAVAAVPAYGPGHYYLGLTLARAGRSEESKRELGVATELAEREKKQGVGRLRLAGQEP